ncbi:UDP-N-acetylmuramate--L-alanine ligase [Kytococcus schroeteri]|uniref:UDP-N-acetylmuramate--L-alanine ligase n=1 Tax=Kytococcus schroeteri TaxID=138300 RepID=UPI001141B00D|nr:UDP-N-acetylmuramate--L-alanine ligase [Kytococcus schroeteri]
MSLQDTAGDTGLPAGGTVAGVPTRFDFRAELPSLDRWRRIHLLNVAGSGVSRVARLLAARGVQVSGSDPADLPVMAALRADGIDAQVGWDPARLEGVGAVVVSSATKEDVPELAEARRRGLPVLHQAQALALATQGRRRVVVAGANGKTSTSAMVAWTLRSVGTDCGYAVGADLVDSGRNAAVGTAPEFVIEGDESDGSFLGYRPEVAVLTNVRPDHLDLYGDFETVQRAYDEFLDTVPDGGVLVACADDPGARAAADRQRGRLRVLTYGFEGDGTTVPDLHLVDPSHRGMAWESTLRDGISGRTLDLRVKVPGLHNLLNATAAYAVAVHATLEAPEGGAGPEVEAAALAGLAGFAGAKRRFQVRGEADGVLVVDDYAHNADKVDAVVRTGAALAHEAGHRVLVAFQPHLYSRTRDFAAGFAAGLDAADEVLLLPVFGAREEPLEGVTSALVGDRLTTSWRAVDSLEELPQAVAALARPGDLVLLVGAGSITTAGEGVLTALQQRR